MIPVILIQQKKYIRKFEKLGATSHSRAIVPEEYGIRKSLAFNKLLRQQIIIEAADGKCYLDQFLANEQRKKRQSILIILCVVIISALILMTLLADYFSGDTLLDIARKVTNCI